MVYCASNTRTSRSSLSRRANGTSSGHCPGNDMTLHSLTQRLLQDRVLTLSGPTARPDSATTSVRRVILGVPVLPRPREVLFQPDRHGPSARVLTHNPPRLTVTSRSITRLRRAVPLLPEDD